MISVRFFKGDTGMRRTGVAILLLGWVLGMIGWPGLVATASAGTLDSQDANIQALTSRLLHQARMTLGSTAAGSRRMIVVDLFRDGDSGEVPMGGQDIQHAVVGTGRQFPEFLVQALTSENVAQADYWIGGTVTRTAAGRKGFRQYQIEGRLVDIWNGREVGRAQVSIGAANFDTTPMTIYRESPFYDSAILNKRIAAPAVSGRTGFDVDGYSLGTRALLMDAVRAYERADYRAASAYLEKAIQRPDGRTLFAYIGLYMTSEQLGRTAAAARAIQHAIVASIKKHEMLMVRFVFEKNSAEFTAEPVLAATYNAWLKHIGAYFRQTDECLQIAGHASRSGAESWNALLSLRRAKFIQKQLITRVPGIKARSQAVGMGARKNLVGIGTDDKHDALDRRVEIVIMDCRRMQAH